LTRRDCWGGQCDILSIETPGGGGFGVEGEVAVLVRVRSGQLLCGRGELSTAVPQAAGEVSASAALRTHGSTDQFRMDQETA
jgi:hypothetical protein